MLKKSKILIILLLMFSLTGCAKMDVTMEIGKDKSMNLVIIEAYDKSLLQSDEGLDDSDISIDFTGKDEVQKYETNGFYVQDYDADGKKGHTMTKQIRNIDDYSTETKLSKEEMTEAISGDKQYLFTVKKSFFKDTYTATYSFDTSSLDSYSNSLNDMEYYDNCLYDSGEGSLIMNCGGPPVEDQEANRAAYEKYIADQKKQLEQLTQGMDLKFNLKLPYGAKSSNATSKTNGGKNLVWDLTQVSDVTFEFEIYNMKNLYIVGGITLFILLMFGTSIISFIKKRKPPKRVISSSYQPSFLNRDEDVNTYNTPYVPNDTYNNPPTYDNNYNNNTGGNMFINNPGNTYDNSQSGNTFINPGINYSNNSGSVGISNSNINIPPIFPQDNSGNNNQY